MAHAVDDREAEPNVGNILGAGDVFTIGIADQQIDGLTLEQAVEKMRGPVNAPITLTIVRKGVGDPFDVKLMRDIIHINPVKAHNEGDVAYIKVTAFNEQTHASLVKAIDEAKKTIGKNVKGYVIDLRNNPGGLLDQAIAVSDDFLEDGAIVITKGRNAEEIQRANAHPGDLADDSPGLDDRTLEGPKAAIARMTRLSRPTVYSILARPEGES